MDGECSGGRMLKVVEFAGSVLGGGRVLVVDLKSRKVLGKW